MIKAARKKNKKVILSLYSNCKLSILPNIGVSIGARILEVKGYQAVATAISDISA